MPAEAADKPSLTLEQGGARLLRGLSWSETPATGATLTYAFRASATAADFQGLPATFVRFNLEQMQAYEMALQAWSDVANLTFQRVGSG